MSVTLLIYISVTSLELEEHMNSVTSLHVIMGDVLLVSQRFASINQTDHWHVNSLFLLESLFDLKDGVGWLEVEGLFHTSKSLYTLQ